MTEVHEYAFDVKLCAVVRARAADQQTARKEILRLIDAADFMVHFKSVDAMVFVTEASVHEDDIEGAHLFEVDGVEID